jgi:hypothetical protein
VTLVNFDASQGNTAGGERAVPGQSEQTVRIATAQPMRAFAAHAAGTGGRCDASREEEDFEEAKLSFGRPAVPSTGFDSGRAGSGKEHPAVWSTECLL